MYKPFLLILLTGILAYCFSQNNQQHSHSSLLAAYKEADKLYTSAEQQFSKNKPTEQMPAKTNEEYHLSLIQFNQLIPKAKNAGYDSLTFFLYLKSAAINYYLDSTADAGKNYLAAFALKDKLPAIPDSLLFAPFLNTGRIYHSENMFDSAQLFYNKAAQLDNKYKIPSKELQGLYDRLGTLHYEIGEYRQARTYIEKAISLLPANTPASDSRVLTYKMNIASIDLTIEEYTEAQKVYESLLSFSTYNNEINLNLGIIKLKQENYTAALGYFNKVNFVQHKKTIDLYYNYGKAYSGLGEADSADLYFHKALAENLKWNGHRSNLGYGIILKYQADELARQEKLDESLVLYQEALSQFDNNFSEKDIYKNPEQFSGISSYINLFNTLIGKANALEQLYQEKKEGKLLETSLQTYQSAFQLANYAAKTYSSDESRVFLGKIKNIIQGKPIETALQLYQLTNQRNYLESVYYFDQLEKAINLLLATEQNKINSSTSPFQELVNKEIIFKSNITRLNLKAAGITDSAKLSNLDTIIKNNESELTNIQKQLSANSSWQQRIATGQIPGVSELQKTLDNTSALLSFHFSESDLLTLFISSTQFEFRKTPINKKFLNSIASFRSSLQNTQQGQLYSGVAAGSELYKTIIGPLKYRLARINRLIIIPGDELNNFPLEALLDENGNYLLEKFSFQYQYTTALLGKNIKDDFPSTALAFAPFAGRAATDSSGNLFSRLPSSEEEIYKLKGKIFVDSAATKNNFLTNANQYSILHLATHSSINNTDPLKTFIAFNPAGNRYKLYQQEILNLNLDSTNLIILSSCKENDGQPKEGNGLTNLSRTFAYAGCPNMIASLWKADDTATALITQRLHYYLDQKYSKDKALQQAKLDFLRSSEIEPEHKTPNHWAHLIFIGTYQPDHEKNNWWWVAFGIIAVLSAFYFTRKKK